MINTITTLYNKIGKEDFLMKCGAKCFIVELEIDGEIKKKSVFSRTPISARKTIRNAYGKEANILTVSKKG